MSEDTKVIFKCPHCGGEVYGEDFVDDSDERSPGLDMTRIQGPDDLFGDLGKVGHTDSRFLIEMWQCGACNGYLRAYYKLDRITKLEEVEIADSPA